MKLDCIQLRDSMIQEAWSSAHTQYSDWLYMARYVGIGAFGYRAHDLVAEKAI